MSPYDAALDLVKAGKVRPDHSDVDLRRLAWAAAEATHLDDEPGGLGLYAYRLHFALVTLVQLIGIGENAADELRREVAAASLMGWETMPIRRVLAVLYEELPPIDPADRAAVMALRRLLYVANRFGEQNVELSYLAAAFDRPESAQEAA